MKARIFEECDLVIFRWHIPSVIPEAIAWPNATKMVAASATRHRRFTGFEPARQSSPKSGYLRKPFASFTLCGAAGADAFQQHRSWLVVRVLWDQLTTECFGEDRLIETIQQPGGGS